MGDCGPQIKKEFSWWIKFWIKILNFVLDRLTPHFIQASCRKHDKGYIEGGDEKRRLECDLKFHYYICRDIEKLKCNLFKKIWLYILASIFFLAVRIGGKMSFNYKKMGYKIKKLNKYCLFHNVNQGDETITRMMCTIYFGFINAKYNGVIDTINEDMIKEVAKNQADKGLFSYKNGGKLEDGINAVFEWLNQNGYDCNLAYTKNDTEVKDWLNRGYAVGIGIKVNASIFYQDKLDGKLDATNYINYKGDDGHATNIIKWNCRGKKDCEDKGKEYFLDSYFSKTSIYECNIDEVLQDIDMQTKYIFF